MKIVTLNKKIILINTVLGIFLFVASLLLYDKLPQTVPNKIGFLGNTTIYGSKNSIFILPVVLLILSFLFSRKWVEKWKLLLSTNKLVQVICYLIILLIWFYSIILYVKWFEMI